MKTRNVIGAFQCLTNVLKPLTEESGHKLQSTENFFDTINTIQIPDDHKLVSFDVKSLFTRIPLQLALDCTENAIKTTTTYRRRYRPTQPLFDFDVLSVRRQTPQTGARYSYGLSTFCCCSRNCYAKHRRTSPSYLYANYTSWSHYVDDIFTTVHNDGIDDFHERLHRQNAGIQFTKEVEEKW